MRSREHQDWNRDWSPARREWRDRVSDDEGEDRRYRGRESYEQQYGGGESGTSDMWRGTNDPREIERDRRARISGRGNEWDQRYRGLEGRDRYEDPDYDWDRSARGSGYPMSGGGMSLDEGRFYSGPTYGLRGPRRTGNAPKGYRRSDERIREDLCDRLSERWDVDARAIEVNVANGEVTLSGTVPERAMKFRAESIADSIGGVSEVHNQLRVSAQTADRGSGS